MGSFCHALATEELSNGAPKLLRKYEYVCAKLLAARIDGKSAHTEFSKARNDVKSARIGEI